MNCVRVGARAIGSFPPARGAAFLLAVLVAPLPGCGDGDGIVAVDTPGSGGGLAARSAGGAAATGASEASAGEAPLGAAGTSAGAGRGGQGGAAGSPPSTGRGGQGGAAGSPPSAGNGGAGGAQATGGSAAAAGGEAGTSGGTGGASRTGPLPLEGEPCVGYTLLASPENDAGADSKAVLIDMEGNVVHRWTITGFVPKMLPGGSLLGCTGVTQGMATYDCREVRQVTWDGELEWSFSNRTIQPDGNPSARQHHDLQREGNPIGGYAPGQDFVPEGNTLILSHQETTVPAIREDLLDDDVIYEVDWAGKFTGFEWHASDHVEEFGFDAYAREDIATRNPGTKLEWLHGNTVARLGPNRWYDAGDERFHPDNLLYSSRRAAFVLIISATTGEVVWRVGPEFAGQPEEALGQFAGQHNPYMIPRGLPGEGNILVFDNGCCSGWGQLVIDGRADRYTRGYSRVLEFNPTTLEPVWEYGAPDGIQNFYSRIISSAQRLPNGNTLITVGLSGYIMEVTPDKRIVWEHTFVPVGSATNAGWLHRANRMPPEWLPTGVNESFGNYETWESLFGG